MNVAMQDILFSALQNMLHLRRFDCELHILKDTHLTFLSYVSTYCHMNSSLSMKLS